MSIPTEKDSSDCCYNFFLHQTRLSQVVHLHCTHHHQFHHEFHRLVLSWKKRKDACLVVVFWILGKQKYISNDAFGKLSKNIKLHGQSNFLMVPSSIWLTALPGVKMTSNNRCYATFTSSQGHISFHFLVCSEHFHYICVESYQPEYSCLSLIWQLWKNVSSHHSSWSAFLCHRQTYLIVAL